MKRYLLRRTIQLIPLFFIVTIMTFGLMHAAPGGPEQIFLASESSLVDPADIEKLKEKWGLNDPFYVQYGKWLFNVVQGDLGRSFASQSPVMETWSERLPATIQLNIVVIILIYLVAIPIGVVSAVRQYSITDYIVTTISFLLDAMPPFWVGLMLIVGVAIKSEGAIPTNGFSTPDVTMATHGVVALLLDRARYMLLPVITIVLTGTAPLIRYMRGSMLDVLREDYIRTARAKGLAERMVIYKHALRNAMLPIVTLSSGLLGSLFGGSAIIEAIFAWPGVGQLSLKAVTQQDHPVVMAFLLFGFFVGTLSSFLTEFVYVLVDPRIKYS